MEEYVWLCGFASSQLCSSQWRRLCQCIYVCINCTPSCSATSICHLGHIHHFPSKVNTPMLLEGLYSKSKYCPSFHTATPLLAHTYAHHQSLCLKHTYASSLKLLSTRRSDVVCYIDTSLCLFCYLRIREIKDGSTVPEQKSVTTYCLKTVWHIQHCMVKNILYEENLLVKSWGLLYHGPKSKL